MKELTSKPVRITRDVFHALTPLCACTNLQVPGEVSFPRAFLFAHQSRHMAVVRPPSTSCTTSKLELKMFVAATFSVALVDFQQLFFSTGVLNNVSTSVGIRKHCEGTKKWERQG